MTEERIYVACLSSYVSGILHGAWIEVTDEETVLAAIDAMLKASTLEEAEEWAIHSHEGFGRAEIGEYESIARVCEIAEFMRKHGELADLVLHEARGNMDDALNLIDNYQGEFNSLGDFAKLFYDAIIGENIPESLIGYIDWEAMARDMQLGGDIIVLNDGRNVHVCWNRARGE